MADAPVSRARNARSFAAANRVSNACTSCRTRKRKCDGARPACGLCSRLGLTDACLYSSTTKPTKNQSSDVVLQKESSSPISSSSSSSFSSQLPFATNASTNTTSTNNNTIPTSAASVSPTKSAIVGQLAALPSSNASTPSAPTTTSSKQQCLCLLPLDNLMCELNGNSNSNPAFAFAVDATAEKCFNNRLFTGPNLAPLLLQAAANRYPPNMFPPQTQSQSQAVTNVYPSGSASVNSLYAASATDPGAGAAAYHSALQTTATPTPTPIAPPSTPFMQALVNANAAANNETKTNINYSNINPTFIAGNGCFPASIIMPVQSAQTGVLSSSSSTNDSLIASPLPLSPVSLLSSSNASASPPATTNSPPLPFSKSPLLQSLVDSSQWSSPQADNYVRLFLTTANLRFPVLSATTNPLLRNLMHEPVALPPVQSEQDLHLLGAFRLQYLGAAAFGSQLAKDKPIARLWGRKAAQLALELSGFVHAEMASGLFVTALWLLGAMQLSSSSECLSMAIRICKVCDVNRPTRLMIGFLDNMLDWPQPYRHQRCTAEKCLSPSTLCTADLLSDASPVTLTGALTRETLSALLQAGTPETRLFTVMVLIVAHRNTLTSLEAKQLLEMCAILGQHQHYTSVEMLFINCLNVFIIVNSNLRLSPSYRAKAVELCDRISPAALTEDMRCTFMPVITYVIAWVHATQHNIPMLKSDLLTLIQLNDVWEYGSVATNELLRLCQRDPILAPHFKPPPSSSSALTASASSALAGRPRPSSSALDRTGSLDSQEDSCSASSSFSGGSSPTINDHDKPNGGSLKRSRLQYDTDSSTSSPPPLISNSSSSLQQSSQPSQMSMDELPPFLDFSPDAITNSSLSLLSPLPLYADLEFNGIDRDPLDSAFDLP